MNKGAQQKSKDKYLKEKVQTFVMRVPIGELNTIDQRAAALGKSRNRYILDLIYADMGKPVTVETNGKTAEGSP